MTELLELFVLGLWTGMVFLATVLVSRWLRGIFRYLKSSYRGYYKTQTTSPTTSSFGGFRGKFLAQCKGKYEHILVTHYVRASDGKGKAAVIVLSLNVEGNAMCRHMQIRKLPPRLQARHGNVLSPAYSFAESVEPQVV
eukprot:g78667.t1